jgi:hypothetical protein
MHPTTGSMFGFPTSHPAKLMAQGKAAVTETEWKGFVRAFKAEMDVPTARRALDLLAALSHGTGPRFHSGSRSISWCHRSVLRELLDTARREPWVAVAATVEAAVAVGQDPVPHG